MASFQAELVRIPTDLDLDYGEDEIWFQWPDTVYGHERLSIDLDGHCSRRMRVRSGQGPPEFLIVGRDYVRLRFPPGLAARLELDEEIEIRFAISDDEFRRLQRTVNYFQGVDEAEPDAAPDAAGM